MTRRPPLVVNNVAPLDYVQFSPVQPLFSPRTIPPNIDVLRDSTVAHSAEKLTCTFFFGAFAAIRYDYAALVHQPVIPSSVTPSGQ